MFVLAADGREGPVSKAELKQAFARGQISSATPMWAAGMAEPQALVATRELRWLTSRRLGNAESASMMISIGGLSMSLDTSVLTAGMAEPQASADHGAVLAHLSPYRSYHNCH